MPVEVLALVCLLSRTLGAKNPATASTPVNTYIAKENRAHKVPGNPSSSCALDPNPIHGSSECLIACLIPSKHLFGFGWNKNSSECRCCYQRVMTSANEVAGEGWETYLADCLDNFYTVFDKEIPRCLHYMNQRSDMQYAEAKSTCENLGGELVISPTDHDPKWMNALVNFIVDMGSNVFFEVVEDDALKPFICEKEPVLEMWN